MLGISARQARTQGGILGIETPPEIQENDIKYVFI
jgi:hypothetical protein